MSVIDNIEWTVALLGASLNLAYGFLMYMSGPTAVSRAEGLEHVKDTMIAVVIFLVFLSLYNVANVILHYIGILIGVNISPDVSIEVYVEKASIFFENLFNSIKTLLLTLFSVCTVLNIVPYTSPVAVYLSQTTQYLQWMAHWALINSYMLHVLAVVSRYSRLMASIGLCLLIPRQTRHIGSLLTALALVLPCHVTIMYAYASTLHIEIVNTHVTVANAVKIAKDIALGGFTLGQELQTFNIMTDLSLALLGAVTYTITKIVDGTGHYLRI